MWLDLSSNIRTQSFNSAEEIVCHGKWRVKWASAVLVTLAMHYTVLSN